MSRLYLRVSSFMQNSRLVHPNTILAGLCVQDPAKRTAILQLLEKTLDITKYPHKTLLGDLTSRWRGAS
jgi:hypothetical protein